VRLVPAEDEVQVCTGGADAGAGGGDDPAVLVDDRRPLCPLLPALGPGAVAAGDRYAGDGCGGANRFDAWLRFGGDVDLVWRLHESAGGCATTRAPRCSAASRLVRRSACAAPTSTAQAAASVGRVGCVAPAVVEQRPSGLPAGPVPRVLPAPGD